MPKAIHRFNKPVFAKTAPPKKMTSGEAFKRRTEDRAVILREDVATKPIRMIPKDLQAKLQELENYRVKSNHYGRLQKAAQAEAEELCEKYKVRSYTCDLNAKDIGNELVPVTVTVESISNGEAESIDRAKLKKLVTPEIYELCTAVQKGLVREHAGEAVLKKCTVTIPIPGTFISITSKKAPKKPKK